MPGASSADPRRGQFRKDVLPFSEWSRPLGSGSAAAINPSELLSALDQLRVRKTAYEVECLDGFDAVGFLAKIGSAQPSCLFCVERDPAACHRALVAEKLADAGATVRHLLP